MIFYISLIFILILVGIYLMNRDNIESFTAQDKPDMLLTPDNLSSEIVKNDIEIGVGSENLCSLYSSQPMKLNEKCGSLTEGNCNVTSCCVWLNGKSCVAGNANGPTFRTNKNVPIEILNYSFMGKLSGTV
jgi:hypothetical protein